MDNLELALMKLIKSGLTGKNLGQIDVEGIDAEQLFGLAKRHHVGAIVYYGALISQVKLPESVFQKLEALTYKLLAISVKQGVELERISESFEKSGIDHMPLKGSVIKQYYPKPEMRYMSDMDILIKNEQINKFSDVMNELGYTYKYESNHEIVWEKAPVFIELHKHLIPTYNVDLCKYYRDDWNYAKKKSNKQHTFELTLEDLYIYSFTHFAKHYRDAGAGIKYLLDIYLLDELDRDENYIEEELKKLQLFEFYGNIKELLAVWFDGKKETEMSKFLTEFIFKSGAYGTKEFRSMASTLRIPGDSAHKKLLKKRLKLFFPPYSHIKERYKFVKWCPILLPDGWLCRIVYTIFAKRDYTAKTIKNLKNHTAKSVDNYKDALEYVGLSYYTEE